MKKTIRLAMALFFTFSISVALSQSKEGQASVKKMKLTEKSISSTSLNLDSIRSQLNKEWRFHQITMRTPKDGYLFSLRKKEIDLIGVLVANYTFNKDGSVTLDEKYIEKQGIKEAKWTLNEKGNLEITYFLTPERQEGKGYTNNFEKMEFTIDALSDEELTINLIDAFIINLVAQS